MNLEQASKGGCSDDMHGEYCPKHGRECLYRYYNDGIKSESFIGKEIMKNLYVGDFKPSEVRFIRDAMKFLVEHELCQSVNQRTMNGVRAELIYSRCKTHIDNERNKNNSNS